MSVTSWIKFYAKQKEKFLSDKGIISFVHVRRKSMQTLVCGKTKQVKVDSEGVFTIIGEKINPTGRKKLAQALAITPGKPLVNSVNGKQESLQEILPLVRERGASVIGLTMDEQGIPKDADGRVKIAGRVLEAAAKRGRPAA